MNTTTQSVKTLTSKIIASISPDHDKGAAHQGNWPIDAEFAVEYLVTDKQFPSVKHEPQVVYFSSMQEMNDWFDAKRAWIVSTDYDFSMSCDMYKWDLGPERLGTLSY